MGAPPKSNNRQVVLDTETTGLEHEQGHRVIEIACVEIVNRRQTRHYHTYLCPDCDIDEGALRVHGITRDFLAGQPRFHDIADELLQFISGAQLVIHNAPFDVGFLNAEFARTGRHDARIEDICEVLDTLVLARQTHPGQRNSLDALCKRYSVDNSHRNVHGALLDARLLADVYLAMTGGQVTLTLGPATTAAAGGREARAVRPAAPLLVVRPSPEELQAHERVLAAIEKIGGCCLWATPAGGT